MKEAMEQVKETLGRDAVILHTKKYKDGGFLGYRSKEIVEVTAAVEEEASPAKTRKRKTVPKEKAEMAEPALDKAAQPILPNAVLAQYKTHGTEQGVEIAAQGVARPAASIQSPSFPAFGEEPFAAAPLEKEPSPTDMMGEGAQRSRIIKAEELKVPGKETEPRGSSSQVQEKAAQELSLEEYEAASKEDAEKIQKLEDELAQMKTLLAQVMSKDSPEGSISLQEALRRQEVESAILDDMAAHSGAGETLADVKSAEAKITLRSYLDRVVKYSDGIQLKKHGPRIAALIGPTGVGKTTTLAKIAAGFVLEKGISAALITADTYRISAVEQLKTYSDIIGLPLEIVYSPEELRMAIRKHNDKQLILIDTAGRSQHNEYQMKELKELLRANSRIEKHLVISATTKSQDAVDILEKFSDCRPERVIFTKVDETCSVGLILNLLYEKEIALSYLAYGQSVPDDIMPASAEKLAELLLRE